MRILPARKRRGTPATSAPARASGSRFRPRLLTVVVFFVAAAVIALANLSYDEATAGNGGYNNLHYRSYGWPVIWHRLVLSGIKLFGNERAIGWYYSLPRLAANLALWLLLLGALAGTCEWLMRRYRPRPRWGLRGLLVFVALAGVLFAWYADARNRAVIQDPLIPLQGGYGVPLVFVDRWGPKWLDLLGMDPLRRRIVLANSWYLHSDEPATEQAFLQLARAPDLRHLLEFHVDELTPTTAKALGGMRQLQTLEIHVDRLTPDLPAALSELTQLRGLSVSWEPYAGDDGSEDGGSEAADEKDGRLADECLAAIGNMTRLESLSLSKLPLHGRGLACLAGLKNLKSLDVDFWDEEWTGSKLERPIPEDCLRGIATLTQLEWLRLENLKVRKESLACLEGLTDLKTLSFDSLVTKDRPMLSHLPPLPRLEALGLNDSNIGDDDLRRLAVLPRLSSLSLAGIVLNQGRRIFTHDGLQSLASVGTLQEIELPFDFGSPEDLEAVGAIKRLKKLHLRDTSFRAWRELTLDDGKILHVDVDALEGFQRALGAIRQSKPGIVIDAGFISLLARPRVGGMADLTAESLPHRPSPWLPGGDTTWMTPQELADFEKEGGRVSFEGATLRDSQSKELITVTF